MTRKENPQIEAEAFVEITLKQQRALFVGVTTGIDFEFDDQGYWIPPKEVYESKGSDTDDAYLARQAGDFERGGIAYGDRTVSRPKSNPAERIRELEQQLYQLANQLGGVKPNSPAMKVFQERQQRLSQQLEIAYSLQESEEETKEITPEEIQSEKARKIALGKELGAKLSLNGQQAAGLARTVPQRLYGYHKRLTGQDFPKPDGTIHDVDFTVTFSRINNKTERNNDTIIVKLHSTTTPQLYSEFEVRVCDLTKIDTQGNTQAVRAPIREVKTRILKPDLGVVPPVFDQDDADHFVQQLLKTQLSASLKQEAALKGRPEFTPPISAKELRQKVQGMNEKELTKFKVFLKYWYRDFCDAKNRTAPSELNKLCQSYRSFFEKGDLPQAYQLRPYCTVKEFRAKTANMNADELDQYGVFLDSVAAALSGVGILVGSPPEKIRTLCIEFQPVPQSDNVVLHDLKTILRLMEEVDVNDKKAVFYFIKDILVPYIKDALTRADQNLDSDIRILEILQADAKTQNLDKINFKLLKVIFKILSIYTGDMVGDLTPEGQYAFRFSDMHIPKLLTCLKNMAITHARERQPNLREFLNNAIEEPDAAIISLEALERIAQNMNTEELVQFEESLEPILERLANDFNTDTHFGDFRPFDKEDKDFVAEGGEVDKTARDNCSKAKSAYNQTKTAYFGVGQAYKKLMTAVYKPLFELRHQCGVEGVTAAEGKRAQLIARITKENPGYMRYTVLLGQKQALTKKLDTLNAALIEPNKRKFLFSIGNRLRMQDLRKHQKEIRQELMLVNAQLKAMEFETPRIAQLVAELAYINKLCALEKDIVQRKEQRKANPINNKTPTENLSAKKEDIALYVENCKKQREELEQQSKRIIGETKTITAKASYKDTGGSTITVTESPAVAQQNLAQQANKNASAQNIQAIAAQLSLEQSTFAKLRSLLIHFVPERNKENKTEDVVNLNNFAEEGLAIFEGRNTYLAIVPTKSGDFQTEIKDTITVQPSGRAAPKKASEMNEQEKVVAFKAHYKRHKGTLAKNQNPARQRILGKIIEVLNDLAKMFGIKPIKKEEIPVVSSSKFTLFHIANALGEESPVVQMQADNVIRKVWPLRQLK